MDAAGFGETIKKRPDDHSPSNTGYWQVHHGHQRCWHVAILHSRRWRLWTWQLSWSSCVCRYKTVGEKFQNNVNAYLVYDKVAFHVHTAPMYTFCRLLSFIQLSHPLQTLSAQNHNVLSYIQCTVLQVLFKHFALEIYEKYGIFVIFWYTLWGRKKGTNFLLCASSLILDRYW